MGASRPPASLEHRPPSSSGCPRSRHGVRSLIFRLGFSVSQAGSECSRILSIHFSRLCPALFYKTKKGGFVDKRS